MVERGVFDPDKSFEKAEGLRLLLQIALAHGKVRDAATDTVIDRIVAALSKLGRSDVDKQLFLQILEADFTWTNQGSPSQDHAVVMVNAAMRVVALAEQQRWPVIEAIYLVSGLALMERIEPKPRRELLVGYQHLGHRLVLIGPAEYAPSMFQKAIDNADALLASP